MRILAMKITSKGDNLCKDAEVQIFLTTVIVEAILAINRNFCLLIGTDWKLFLTLSDRYFFKGKL